MRYNTLGIQVTNLCNMTCAHCITDSSPSARGDLDWPDIDAAVRSAAPHVDGVCVTGGEPLLRRDLTLQTIALTRELGLRSSMVSNGYWAKRPELGRPTIHELIGAGLQKLAISFDRFHNRLISDVAIANLLEISESLPLEIQLQYCGNCDDDAYDVATGFAARYDITLLTATVLPFGRGLQLARRDDADIDQVPDTACGVAVRPVLTPEGDLYTCCGPARGASPLSPLRLTAPDAAGVGDALGCGASDPILNTIYMKGPRALLPHLSPETVERVGARLLDNSICSLCRTITDDADAVAELRDALADDRMRLMAVSAVMAQARQKESVGGSCRQ